MRNGERYVPGVCRGAGSIDACYGDQLTPAYRAGVRALKAWHAECERRRRGLSRNVTLLTSDDPEKNRCVVITIDGKEEKHTLQWWCLAKHKDINEVWNKKRSNPKISWRQALGIPPLTKTDVSGARIEKAREKMKAKGRR